MKKSFQQFGYLNGGLFLVILFFWISVYWIHGLPGAYAWASLKLIFPIAGLIGLAANFFTCLVYLRKKKKLLKTLINLLLNFALVLPLLLTMNIVKLAYPVHIQDLQPSITVQWPLAEPAVVGWGGDTVENNLPHVIWPSERWAYDLVMKPYDTGSGHVEEYGIWDQEVLAPVAGTVVAAFDQESDIPPGTEDNKTLEGNHVYLQIDATGTYLLLNHLKKDSLTVSVGDHVSPGDILGHVGNSGSTSEPHLHIHHQRQNPVDTPYPILAEGLPLYFENTEEMYMPDKGTEIIP